MTHPRRPAAIHPQHLPPTNLLVAIFLWYLLAERWQVGPGYEAVGYAAIAIFVGGAWLRYLTSHWVQIEQKETK